MPTVFAAPGHVEMTEQLTFGDVTRAFEELAVEFTEEVLVAEQWVLEEWAPETGVVRRWTAAWEPDPALGRIITWIPGGWEPQ